MRVSIVQSHIGLLISLAALASIEVRASAQCEPTASYGAGSPGSGGVVPQLNWVGDAVVGTTSQLVLSGGLGGAQGVLAVSSTALVPPLPFLGVALNVSPVGAFVQPLVLDGNPGQPGAGSFALPVPVTPTLIGASFVCQAFVVDPGAVELLSATAGLHVCLQPPVQADPLVLDELIHAYSSNPESHADLGQLLLVDYNDDALDDLFLAKHDTGIIRQFQGLSDGGFELVQYLPVPALAGFVVEDFDSDGDFDLAAVSRLERALVIFWNDPLRADRFDPDDQSVYAYDGIPISLDLFDFEGDGVRDFVVALMPFDLGRVVVSPMENPASIVTVADQLDPHAIYDLSELEVGRNGLLVLSGDSARISYVEPNGAGGAVTTDMSSQFPGLESVDHPKSALLVDFDADGDRDLVLWTASEPLDQLLSYSNTASGYELTQAQSASAFSWFVADGDPSAAEFVLADFDRANSQWIYSSGIPDGSGVYTIAPLLALEGASAIIAAGANGYQYSQATSNAGTDCVQNKVELGDQSVAAFKQKLCDVLDCLTGFVDQLPDGHASKVEFPDILEELNEQKDDGDLSVAELPSGVLAKAFPWSDNSVVFADTFKDTECDPTKQEYWKLVATTFHEGVHIEEWVGEGGATSRTLEFLKAVDADLSNPAGYFRSVKGYTDAQATSARVHVAEEKWYEKWYQMREDEVYCDLAEAWIERICDGEDDDFDELLAQVNKEFGVAMTVFGAPNCTTRCWMGFFEFVFCGVTGTHTLGTPFCD